MIAVFLASKSDEEFAKPMFEVFKEFGVSAETYTASAHKVPEKVLAIVTELNKRTEPTVVITVVGMSNGLGGVVAGSCVHPVITCPVFKDLADYQVNIHSSLQLPSEIPVLTILHPKNAALSAIRILAQSDEKLRWKVRERMEKVKQGY